MTDAERIAEIREALALAEAAPDPDTRAYYADRVIDEVPWLLEQVEAQERRLTANRAARRRCCDLADHGHRQWCPNAPHKIPEPCPHLRLQHAGGEIRCFDCGEWLP